MKRLAPDNISQGSGGGGEGSDCVSPDLSGGSGLAWLVVEEVDKIRKTSCPQSGTGARLGAPLEEGGEDVLVSEAAVNKS